MAGTSSARGSAPSPGRLLAPAIDYAEDGFPVSEIIAADWQAPSRACRRSRPRPPASCRAATRPRRARSSATPASPGRSGDRRRTAATPFTAGRSPRPSSRYSQAVGGLFTLRDFADHTSTWVEPVSTNYRGYDVWELPPNGQGIAVLQMLNLLEPYDLKTLGPQFGRGAPPDDRGQEAGLRGPGQVTTPTPNSPRCPVAQLDLEGLRRPTRPTLIDPIRPTRVPRPGEPGRGRHDLPDGGRQGLQLRQPDPEQLPRLRLVPRPGRPRLPAPEPRLPVRPRPDASPTGWSRTSGRSTRSFPASSPRTASPGSASA